MTRDPRYDVLFEPVQIGPKTARNRFYQVPHCNGMGRTHPSTLAEMRGIKAEGGWAVICTEEVEFHYTSDVSPSNEGRLWDDQDMPAHIRMVEKVQEHGSLAGIELVHNGHHSSNRYTREAPWGVSCRPVESYEPGHTRAMDREDIRNFRKWHKDAALRAKRCGYDLIYVYCAHDLTMQMNFLSRRYNDRTDEYGGSLENRVRLFRETLEDTLDAVGDSCGVPVRFAVDELLGSGGISCEDEGRDVVEMLAEMPHLWDVNISDWDNDSQTSRFSESGFQEPFISFVKKVTTKPVLGVGRYTSPDKMVSLINKGVMDMIGAARPSIADPFLPKKIEEGRIEDIRECIGCNICVIGDHQAVPMRCTQNPTVGEEWRRDWHPERVNPKKNDDRVLVVGAGPAGLEAARVLGERGHDVILAEATEELGGRVARESKLPGLSEWGRVKDYREYQIQQMANVEVYRASELTSQNILEFGAQHVAIATGAHWRNDGVGRANRHPLPGANGVNVFTPDDVMDGAAISGPVVIFDDDHYYMGGVVAEKLRKDGCDVVLVTPAADASNFTNNSLEHHRVQKALMEMGVEIIPYHNLVGIAGGAARISCGFTDREREVEAGSVVLVTALLPNLVVWEGLQNHREQWADAGIQTIERIGDAHAPHTIAAAVWSGHRFAREVGEEKSDGVPFKREIAELAAE